MSDTTETTTDASSTGTGGTDASSITDASITDARTTRSGARPRELPARRIGWLAMLAVLAVALVIGVTQSREPSTPTARAQNLSEQLMCPTCKGQSVADSGSSASNGIRQYIDTRIAEGASDDQIRDELAREYGDDIVLTPGRSGLAGLVWALPVAVLIAAVAGVGLAFRRWRHRAVVHASAADRALVERSLEEMGTG